MPRREVEFLQGEFYHLYNRGNDRQPIFFDDENYLFFLKRIRRYLMPGVRLHAYCLMPNHYHLLVEVAQDIDLSDYMKKLIISYTKAVNKRYEKVGHLFQGPFKAKDVGTQDYFLHLSRYIHLNARIAKLVQRAEDWEFSSYRDYLGVRRDGFVTTGRILSHFRGIDDYREYVELLTEAEIEKIQGGLY